jgi:hypothetical protein
MITIDLKFIKAFYKFILIGLLTYLVLSFATLKKLDTTLSTPGNYIYTNEDSVDTN